MRTTADLLPSYPNFFFLFTRVTPLWLAGSLTQGEWPGQLSATKDPLEANFYCPHLSVS